MQRRTVRGIVMAGIGGVAILTVVTSGGAQTFPSPPTVPTFTLPSFPTIPSITLPPPTMPPSTSPTTSPPPTMPPTTSPNTTSPPPTMPPVSVPPNIDSLIDRVVDELEQFGDDFADLIDSLREIQGGI